MSTARLLIGDVFDGLATIETGSIDLVLTSPPFLALRSYLPTGHRDKAKEIGSEPTPAQFLDTLLALTAEWRRVLAPHGSICVELGDTYSGSGGAGGDYAAKGLRDGQAKFKGSAATARAPRNKAPRPPRSNRDAADWPLPKSLCGIPTLYAWSLAYGRNLLTGEPSPAGQWRVRNLIAWCRPNPPVGALGDKFRPATSYLTVATISGQRWFDLDAVRHPAKSDPAKYAGNGYTKGNPAGNGKTTPMAGNPAGAPPLDWWAIPTQAYKGSHYAVWPPALLDRPIKSMCPRQVCTTCGEPRRRIVETQCHGSRRVGASSASRGISGGDSGNLDKLRHSTTTTTTLGWSDCGHGTWRPGNVLDPFAGSGTTLKVATDLDRDALGIDIDDRNADLFRDRADLTLFTTVIIDRAVAS